MSNTENIKVAVVDIGSNSVRMNIYEIDEEKNISVLDRRRNILGLVGYVFNGNLTPDGEGKLFTVLREYLVIANQIPVERFCVFATASLRAVENSDEVIDKIYKGLGIKIEIIDGLLEAEYDNIAVINRFNKKLAYPFYVLDMGGGSTEINFNYIDRKELHSIPVGSLALSKMFVKNPMHIKKNEYKRIEKYVKDTLLKEIVPAKDIPRMYVIGGTTRSASRMCIGERGEKYLKTDGKKYTAFELNQLSQKLESDNIYARDMVNRYCPDRTTSVLAGIYAFNLIVKILRPKKIISCGNGVREGYLDTQIDSILSESSDI